MHDSRVRVSGHRSGGICGPGPGCAVCGCVPAAEAPQRAIPDAAVAADLLTVDPQARQQAGRRLVRLIAGNPVTMGQMTRHVADAGSYAPVTILLQQRPGGTRVAYDSVASALAPYHDAAASQVARRLDTEVLGLLRQVVGVPASASA